ncbi:ABC transporter permease [Rapidithrix thailandica]|uniref:ABC transporter permease n=1 Tax=Rapidithrix thailandica TaxID=413964 RepID=A0AAW9S9W0_9BACT
MFQSLYLALQYLKFYKYRTLVLAFSLGVILFLPNGLQKLIHESEQRLMNRAKATPLLVGAKGSPTDLVINTLYFQQEEIETVNYHTAQQLNQSGLGISIPLYSVFTAQNFPIVGTTLEYFHFRKLSLLQGRNLSLLGECVIGATVAETLDLQPGDSLISSPQSFFDLAGVYPLKMKVVGVLAPSDSPDDQAVFTDLKTTWIIQGLGHGHQDMVKVEDPSLILEVDKNNIKANAKLYLYNEINEKNRNSFHFHGDMNTYPITSVIVVPHDQKSATLLRGRFVSGELPHQIAVPQQVVNHLLQSIFRIKQLFNAMFVLVGLATVCILGLILALSIRLRQEELLTFSILGSSKRKVAQMLSLEIIIVLVLSTCIAFSGYFLTGFFVEDFINLYVL